MIRFSVFFLILFSSAAVASEFTVSDLYRDEGRAIQLRSGNTLQMRIKKTSGMDEYCIKNQRYYPETETVKFIAVNGKEYEDCYSAFIAR